MATTQPSTPEPSSTRRATMNRSFTVPSKLEVPTTTRPNVEIGSSKDVETLFKHPKANIIKFTTKSVLPRPSSNQNAGSDAGKLPWASPTESTLAAGPLEIYRIPGSVSFLHSGALLHAIMPRSQCWCVDGVSKFAMRVLPDTYYRIELPGDTEDDLLQVEGIKECLKKVLFYEKTPCPFARTFTVDLPEALEESFSRKKSKRRSDGPAKKWKLDKAYSWKPEGWKPEDGPWPPERRGSNDSSAQNSPSGSDDETDSSRERQLMEAFGAAEDGELSDQVKELSFNTPTRPKALSAATRSITAPPKLTLRSTPPSKVRVMERANGTIEATALDRPTPSRLEPGRLRTFQAIPTDMPPSPPDSRSGLEVLDSAVDPPMSQIAKSEANEEKSEVAEDIREDDCQTAALESATEASPSTQPVASAESEARHVREAKMPLEATASQPSATEEDASPSEQLKEPVLQPSPELRESRPRTPSPRARSALQELVEAAATASSSQESSTKAEDPYAAIQARIRARRTLSTKISSSSLTRKASSNSTSSASSTVSTRGSRSVPHDRNIAAAMVARAYSAFLGPPAQLVAIMLRIANRLTHGAFGAIFVESPAGFAKRVPGSFFLSEEGHDEDLIDPEWEEDMDDFGVPLRSPVRLAARRRTGDDQREDMAVASGRTSLSID